MSVTSSQPAVWKGLCGHRIDIWGGSCALNKVLLWEVATPLVTWLECCTPGCYIQPYFKYDTCRMLKHILYIYIYIPIILYVGSATGIQGAIWGCTSSKSGRQITACPARWGDSIATVNFTCYCSMHEHCLNLDTKNRIVIVVRLGNHVILFAA